jgi:hypothetical protein
MMCRLVGNESASLGTGARRRSIVAFFSGFVRSLIDLERAQFVPQIAKDPSVEVINFCRSPQWYIPRVSFELHSWSSSSHSGFTFWRFSSSSLTIPVGLNGSLRASRSRCGLTALSLWAGYILCLIGVISAAACSCRFFCFCELIGRSSILALPYYRIAAPARCPEGQSLQPRARMARNSLL